MTSSISMTEPGQPCEMISGSASGCCERTWMKWMSTPSISVMNCGSAFSRVASRPTSYSAPQKRQSCWIVADCTPCEASSTSSRGGRRMAARRRRRSASASSENATRNGRMALRACCSTVVMTGSVPLLELGGRKSQSEGGQGGTPSASRAARARSRLPGRPSPCSTSRGVAQGPKAPARHVGTAGGRPSRHVEGPPAARRPSTLCPPGHLVDGGRVPEAPTVPVLAGGSLGLTAGL